MIKAVIHLNKEHGLHNDDEFESETRIFLFLHYCSENSY